MENTKITPGSLIYNKLLSLKGNKVFLRKPPEKEPQESFWELNPELYWLEHVGKRKSRVRGSYSPRTEAISVSNKRIVEQAVWNEARDRWEKEKMWKTLAKVK